jgi:CBS domain-containing protein
MITQWFAEPDWENVRYLLIQADMRFLYGDERLAQELRLYYHSLIEANPKIIEHMLQNTLHHKVSLGVFGQLIRERYGEHAGGVDIKYGAYIPFINGIRLLSIAFGMNDVSTLDRMRRMAESSSIPSCPASLGGVRNVHHGRKAAIRHADERAERRAEVLLKRLS